MQNEMGKSESKKQNYEGDGPYLKTVKKRG